jgi:hypothetical protein
VAQRMAMQVASFMASATTTAVLERYGSAAPDATAMRVQRTQSIVEAFWRTSSTSAMILIRRLRFAAAASGDAAPLVPAAAAALTAGGDMVAVDCSLAKSGIAGIEAESCGRRPLKRTSRALLAKALLFNARMALWRAMSL